MNGIITFQSIIALLDRSFTFFVDDFAITVTCIAIYGIIEQIILHWLICRRLIGLVTNSRYQAVDRNVERKSSCLDVVKPRSV